MDGTRSELSGSSGDVVQARDVSGGVHFHGVERKVGQVPRQLPGEVRSFVNRTGELAKLDDPVAVWVITGSAGVGKTALALHWAHRVRERFPDGQLYVNLRGYDPGSPVTPEYTLDHFLRALNIDPGAIPADLDAKASMYRSLVADKRVLIVLDNAATAGQVRPLLPGSSSCQAVVTSRSRLPGLSVRDGARRITVSTLTDDQSVELISVVTDYYRSGDDPADLAELARLCARLPLALRIAAERAAGRPHMPLGELIRDLRDGSSLWDALSTEDDEDADAVRTVFAWSYRALTPDAARLFRLLGLHPGSQFCRAAAEALVGDPVPAARQALNVLIGANLLEQTGADRFEFHDLLRAYAVDQAHREESEEDRQAALRRVLTWYLHTAAAARPAIVPGGFAFPVPVAEEVAPPDNAVAWYETERANLIAATHAAAAAGFDSIAWQIPAVLARVYHTRDPVDTWLTAEQAALDAARRSGDRLAEAVILDGLGVGSRMAHRLSDAIDHHRAAVEIFRQLGDRFGEARSMNGLGNVYLFDRRLELARECFEQGLAIARSTGHRSLTAVLLTTVGGIYNELGLIDESISHLQEAIPILRDLGEELDEIIALRLLGTSQLESLQLAAARESFQRSLGMARERDNQQSEGWTLLALARLELAEGNPADSLISARRALTILRPLGHRSLEARALEVTGSAHARLGRFDDAAPFFRKAVAIHRELGDTWLLASSLYGLGTVLDEKGARDELDDIWREAAELLARLDGRRARTLRIQVEERLP